MPLEIEVKLRVADLGPVREALTAAGAAFAGIHHETNLFFDRPDRSLHARDSGLRIRLTRTEGFDRLTSLMTFKGPRQHGGLRPREAFDLTVTPAEDAIPFLRALGYEQTLSFEKRRESWELDGCKVELDTLPQLGTFVEVEGPSEDQIARVQEKIGLAGLEPARATYIGMVAHYLQERGGADRALRFA